MSRIEKKAIIYTSPEGSVYFGNLERVLKRVNAASTLLMSTDHELELTDPLTGQSHRSKSFLLPAGINLDIDTHHASVAWFFLDDLGSDLAKFIPQMQHAIKIDDKQYLYSDISREAELIELAAEIKATKPSAEHVFSLFDAWKLSFAAADGFISDERVEKAVALIKDNYASNLPVGDIAKQVNLSVPRLVQLFKQVTGTPIRRFRLWHRVCMTALKTQEGFSMTDAAISAGFSDYAQFSRVYRELSGGSPAAAKNNTEIRVLAI